MTTLVSRGAFAQLHGVSKPAVAKWEKRGLLSIVDGKVSVEASDRKLMHAGMGRYSDRPRNARAAPSDVGRTTAPQAGFRGPDSTEVGIAPEVLMPLATNLLVSYFNRICAFAGLSAWEHGASLETAKKADETFRHLAMSVATDILTEIDVTRPEGFIWENQPIWDLDLMAAIDWSAVEEAA